MKNAPTVSIIIPVKEINDYIRESVLQISKLNYKKWEIIIVTDESPQKSEIIDTNHYITIIPSGPVSPAVKRDLGASKAKGEILAFLDDDAYPNPDWLDKVLPHFKDEKARRSPAPRQVAGAGGPALTPKDDNFGQKISGAVFESVIGGGGARNRYLPIGASRKIDDWPTVNLLVRKDVFKKIGGFNSAFWPGEDTKLCLDIIKSGYKIIYEPRAIVWHHRRAGLIRHLNQIGQYARHRGYFAKKYPATSFRLAYFIPSIFFIWLLSGSIFLLIFNSQSASWRTTFNQIPIFQFSNYNHDYWLPITIYWLYVLCFMFYVLCLVLDGFRAAFRHRAPLMIIMLPIYIFLTHIWYGIRFIQGLAIREFKSELRK